MKIEEKVLKVRKRILSEKHPDTLMSINNLALSYNNLGQRQEAIELQEKVLKMRKKILGEKHPDTLVLMNNLVSSYKDLGHRQEAVELQEKVVKASKRILSEKHPDTLLYISKLTMLSASQNALSELPEQSISSKERNKLFRK